MGNIRADKTRVGIRKRRGQMRRSADFADEREARIGTSKDEPKQMPGKSTLGSQLLDFQSVMVMMSGFWP
jgi:hypothetical protein